MEKIIWLLTFFPARISVGVLSITNMMLFSSLQERGILQKSLLGNTVFEYVFGGIVSTCCIVFAILGGKIGCDYIEMFRSRSWHYHKSRFNDYNEKAKNIIYWAGKFACIPIVIALLIVLIWCFLIA